MEKERGTIRHNTSERERERKEERGVRRGERMGSWRDWEVQGWESKGASESKWGSEGKETEHGMMERGANKKEKKKETDGGFLLSNSEPTCWSFPVVPHRLSYGYRKCPASSNQPTIKSHLSFIPSFPTCQTLFCTTVVSQENLPKAVDCSHYFHYNNKTKTDLCVSLWRPESHQH